LVCGGPGSAVHRCALHRIRDARLNAVAGMILF
jgi:hypothetical protein